MKKLLLVLLLCLLPLTAFGAALTQYVDTDVVGGAGDGSSWANAYATLSAWEAQNLDLTDNGGDTLTVYCKGATDDTTDCDILGWTTSATNTITIVGYEKTKGKWDNDDYSMGDTANGYPLLIHNPNIILDGIQFWRTGGSADRPILGISTNANNVTVKNCIFKSDGAYVTTGIDCDNAASSTIYIYNNIFYGLSAAGSEGIYTDFPTAQVMYVYNNTAYANTTFIRTAGSGLTLTMKNNIAYNNTQDYTAAAGSLTTSNNLAKDTSSPDNTYDSKTLYFVDASTSSGTTDYHLEARDTDAIDDGADLSGTFTTDIDGVTRSGTWDIGADEYVASGGTTSTPFFTTFGD